MTLTGSSFTLTTTTPVLLIGSSTDRVSSQILNTGSTTAFLGFTNSVTSGTGFPLRGGEKLVDKNTKGLDWYGVLGASSATVVKVIEEKITNVN